MPKRNQSNKTRRNNKKIKNSKRKGGDKKYKSTCKKKGWRKKRKSTFKKVFRGGGLQCREFNVNDHVSDTVITLGEDCRDNNLPDLNKMNNLETLKLDGCTSLAALPEGLWQLQALTTLTMLKCTSLTGLPESLGQLETLKEPVSYTHLTLPTKA